MPTREITGPIEKTFFPAFAQIINDKDRLKMAYRSAQTLVAAVALPTGIGCALIAHPLVLLSMGVKWLPAADVIQVLACIFALHSLVSTVYPLAMAKGETKLLFQRDLLCFVIRVPFVILGMYLGGLLGIIYGRAISGLIGVMINMNVVRRLVGIALTEQLLANMRSLVSVMFMAAGVLSIQYLIGDEGTPFFLEYIFGLHATPFPLEHLLDYDEKTLLMIKLGAYVITGAVLYVAVHLTLWLLAKKPIGPETEILRMFSKLLMKLKPTWTKKKLNTKRAGIDLCSKNPHTTLKGKPNPYLTQGVKNES